MARTPKNTVKLRRLSNGDRIMVRGIVTRVWDDDAGRQLIAVDARLGAKITVHDDRRLHEGDEVELEGAVTKMIDGPLEPLVAARLDGYVYPISMRESEYMPVETEGPQTRKAAEGKVS